MPSPTHKLDYVTEGLARLLSSAQKPRPGAAPTIATIDPPLGPTVSGLSVTIKGSDFTGASAVTIGGSACTSVVVVDPATITCVIPAKAQGIWDVVVTAPFGIATLPSGFRTFTGLNLFLRGDRGVTLNGSNVSAWADQSPAGNHWAQATGGNQPPFNGASSNLNSKPSLGPFRSGARHLLHNKANVHNPPWTLFIVFYDAAIPGSVTYLYGNRAEVRQDLYASNSNALHFLASSGANDMPAGAGTLVGRHVAAAVQDGGGGTDKIYVDALTPGISAATFSPGALFGTTGTTSTIGVYSGDPTSGTYNFDGEIAEMIAITGALLSAPELAFVMNYLGGRYGVSIGP